MPEEEKKVNKPVTKTTKKPAKKKKKVLTPEEKAEKERKKVTIIGIGEVGIGALYELSELNFNSYETVKYETREEFKVQNDDYGITDKKEIKKSRLVIALGDFNDLDSLSALEKIYNDAKSKTNVIIAIGEEKYKNNFTGYVDSCILFDKEKLTDLAYLDLGDTIGYLTKLFIAPTIVPGLINFELSDLLVLLRTRKVSYFGLKCNKDKPLNEIVDGIEDTFNSEANKDNILVNFVIKNDTSINEVYSAIEKINETIKREVFIEVSLAEEDSENKEIAFFG